MNSPNHKIFRVNREYERLMWIGVALDHTLRFDLKLVKDVQMSIKHKNPAYYLPAEYNPNLFFNNKTFRRMIYKHG